MEAIGQGLSSGLGLDRQCLSGLVPDWAQLLADIDQKRMEHHCPFFDIEEPAGAH
jgi:hypothetical protein